MNQFPLKKGQMYTQLPNGEFVPVNPSEKTVAPVPAEDLPPDLRTAEAPVNSVSTPAPEAKPVQSKPKKAAATKKAEKILNEMQEAITKSTQKLEKTPAKPKITEADRRAFLAAVISNTSFKKEYFLFGKKLKVTFKTITAFEAESVTEAIVIQSGRVPYSNILAMSAAHFKYSMTCSIYDLTSVGEEGISIKKFESPFKLYSDEPRKSTYYVKDGIELKLKEGLLHASPGQKVLWASIDHFADINVVIYNALFKCFQEFDALIAEMVKEASSEDFFIDGVSGL